MKSISLKMFLCTLCLLGGLSGRAFAAASSLVVILLPGTSLQDWQNANAPNLHRLMQTGAMAVMNTRTAHKAGGHERETPQSALLTLGAGSRTAGTNAALFLPAKAKPFGLMLSCGELYARRTDLMPRPDEQVCIDWPAVVKANSALGYDLRLGNLADTLTAHGITVESGGGPDADWVAAGNGGTVRHVLQLQAAPGHCLIWDARANVAAADAVIERAAVQTAAARSTLIVLSPYASDAQYQHNERLTPLLVWDSTTSAGLLTSQSTRRPGLVTSTDFAPAVAAYFGVPRGAFHPLPFGFAWSVGSTLDNTGLVARLNSGAIHQAQGMRVLPYLAVVLGVWILGVTLSSAYRPRPAFFVLLPIAALLAALFAVSLSSFWVLLPISLAGVSILTRLRGTERLLILLTAAITLALVVDMVSGSFLMRHGLLGYSAIEGARYYGIGNEAMGLLLGSALVVTAHFWPNSRGERSAVTVLLAGIVLLLGSAGAKAGGVLVSLAIFGTFLYTLSGKRWTWRAAAILGSTVLFGMGAAALSEAFLVPKAHSHIGEAVSRITTGGTGEALDIVTRKLAVEGRLMYHSAWAVLLWPGVLCTSYLWKQMPVSDRTDTAARSAGTVGVIACLALNDAGAVAAALFTVVLWTQTLIQKQSLLPLEVSRNRRL